MSGAAPPKSHADGREFDEVKLLGNDAEEGFRGIMLSLAAFNTAVDVSGLQMAENYQTGELGYGRSRA
ncbi:MAG: hypothetical protein CO113_04170 [Elusimicrobia bacterium CG_4_9_14_3_um_filter_62_55]|nr:MAG: hypothetical protein COR54_12580 [Elusimicrobia bacterium CG22_combo_CG10-13_8_21_14_all_63_91]PJA16846.1 MAG: hypothetical protein COX66_06495 [Elusimicrobia bacterium CG_4_10_14_0_2_um_filter_63_34]PJB26315.1 MAG: hypothetical protein CO113_04170 [Elusimicrobia bacterium CG_4_9_14_3_um_filter_62_55]